MHPRCNTHEAVFHAAVFHAAVFDAALFHAALPGAEPTTVSLTALVDRRTRLSASFDIALADGSWFGCIVGRHREGGRSFTGSRERRVLTRDSREF